MTEKRLTEVVHQFCFEGELQEAIPYGNGHINDTYRLTFCTSSASRRYILQCMNKSIFKKPVQLMENIQGVTGWLKKKIQQAGGNPERETLNIIPCADGCPYYVDSDGDYWRAYLFIEDSTCLEKAEKPEDFYQSGLAFGHFQGLLSDYPAETLYETIPDFHHTAKRLEKFYAAVQDNVCGRCEEASREIQFVRDREKLSHMLCDMQEKKELPLRVTHNDTKLNNILLDSHTGQAICVIDLDTVMPGLSVNDFGDSIRFGASTAAEDEPDLSKVHFSMELFEAYTRGFLEGCAGRLTERELDMLPWGAILMTFECGMRFLTDYLEGDHYFKIHRPAHNLDRCRTQFRLVEEMEEKLSQMAEAVRKYR